MTDRVETGELRALDGGALDVVVVGGGPAGSMTARELARRGIGVLLVEKREMPRWKVCGACVGALGARTLARVGLGGLLGSIGARELAGVEVYAGERRARVGLHGMASVSRGALDAALVSEAAAEGARVVTGVIAARSDGGNVLLRTGETRVEVVARAVVLACGLGSGAAWGLGEARVRDASWIGVGTVTEWDRRVGDGSGLVMLVGRRGYLGCARLEDGRANWAAAVDPEAVRAAGSVEEALRGVCAEAGMDASVVPGEGWKGTPRLTRVGCVEHGGTYAVGDAAGYVEPITGEGISWAMAGGVALGEHLAGALTHELEPGSWARQWRRMMRVRRARCALVAQTLRHPGVVSGAVAALGWRPALGGVVVAGLIGSGAREEVA
ncbi:MAG: FAD-dependent oxidoreductase [Phycisphaerales bacterium]